MKVARKSLLTLGECMVELAPQQDGAFRMGFAGDTFNTAWYARRQLGADWAVAFGTCVGTDPLSDQLVAYVDAQGIDSQYIQRVSDRTLGLYMIQLDRGERSFSYWRGQSAAKLLADDPARLETMLTSAGLVLLSGITVAILAPDARNRLISALAAARKAGTVVAFDTNLRQRLWTSNEEMCASIMDVAAVSDIMFPSFDEETAAFGDRSPEKTAKRYEDAGASLVVVKNGIDPLTIWSKDDGLNYFKPTPAPAVIDTTAAGDSFNAGFLSAWLQGGTLADAAEAGMALSAKVVQGQGALVDV
ncbi:sugar kinase [Pseudoruegeria sp. SK021]|uniref:sugar kinase n=1 Tax=Pseudoruegeria sp. SK021 TaxID=1933035 RepID=UPI000A258EC8|nr:sugar kinase [Pseudoruegeria sp. SK021]OSP55991.1 2-dehydro-3-deoxygluconokinase [Pseudoruegeria sp. SK021]